MRTLMMVLALVAIASMVEACGRKGLGVGSGRGDAAEGDTGGAVGSGGLGAGGVATGGADGSDGIDRRADGSADGIDGRAGSSIVGRCTVDADCVAVLDYRAGFECYAPSAASLADLARDACLVPWNSNNPRCPTVTPPSDCPGGPIPVGHSCPRYCQFPACTAGTCTMEADFSTPSRCTTMDAGAPPGCDTLRATYLSALNDALACDPTRTPTGCFNAFYDRCGCPAAADLSSPRANALQCALDALQQAHCGFENCGTPCPSGSSAPACIAWPTIAGTAVGRCAIH